MSILTSNFKPAPYLCNPHVQTMLAKFWPRRIVLNPTLQRLELADGDFVDCHWVGEGTGPIVVILHGLEGSIQSHYIQGLLCALSMQGYRAVVMHFRGCSTEPNRLPRAYHSGDVDDLAALLAFIKQQDPDAPLYAVGYSLGGNVLLKWLGEKQYASLIDKAVAVSVPYQLAPCVAHINQGFLKIYQQRFVKQLKLKMAQKISTHQLDYLQQHLENITTLYEFDDKMTAPLHGFSDAEDYYAKASCYPFLKNITTPTLLIHAKDDPMVPHTVIPSAKNLSAALTLELSEHGGHVGFIDYKQHVGIKFYLEERIPAYLSAQ